MGVMLVTRSYESIIPEVVTPATFQKLEQELNSIYLERQNEIKGVLVATVARANILFIGERGAAKTALAESTCKQIDGANYFQRLLTRVSAPEELFGALSIKGLENDQYIRNGTGKLQEAEIAVIDEIFKCNSAVLNTLLPIMNERVYFTDQGTPVDIPLMCLVCMSNELPETGASEGELAPLYDRLHLKYEVKYIQDERNFLQMLKNKKAGKLSPSVRLTLGQIKHAQLEAKKVTMNDGMFNTLVRLWKELTRPAKKDAVRYNISDRKFNESINLLCAHAWLDGRTEVCEDDLEILSHSFWDTPDQYKNIRKVIMSFANPLVMQATDYYDTCVELLANIKGMERGNERNLAVNEANQKFVIAQDELLKLINIAKSDGKPFTKIEQRLEQVKSMNQELVNILLGITKI